MRILVLGGDGYLGWPTALYLSRRDTPSGLSTTSPGASTTSRWAWTASCPCQTCNIGSAAGQELSGLTLDTYIGDLTDATFVSETFASFAPDAIVHFAEQRSAPYSMIDRQHATYTQVNNVVGTLNILYAIAEHNPTSIW